MKSTLFLSVLLLVGVLAYTSSACNNCTGSTPICSTDGVTCVGCSANSQCWAISSNMETCDTLTGACGACNSSASCSDALPICGAAGFCTACNASAECNEHLAGSVCDFGTGTCGWCFNSTDCLGYGTGYTCENVTTTIRRCTAPAFTIPGAPDPNNLAGVITAYVIICIVLLMLFIMFIVCACIKDEDYSPENTPIEPQPTAHKSKTNGSANGSKSNGTTEIELEDKKKKPAKAK